MTLQIKEKTKRRGSGWRETKPSVSRRSEGVLKVSVSQEERGKDVRARSVKEYISLSTDTIITEAVMQVQQQQRKPGPARFLGLLCHSCG